MRRYQTKNGGYVLLRASTDLVEHCRFAIAEARAGRRAWIKSKDPDDDLARFYSAEFRNVNGTVLVTCFEWHIIINPRDAMAPEWLKQLATTVDNLTMQGATT